MQSVENTLRDITQSFSGRLTLALSRLDTNEHIGIDEHAIMPTASVIKVPVLVALYRAAASGRLSLDDRITYGPEHDSIGSGVLNQLHHGVQMSLHDAAMLMIIISDNVATNMCLDALDGFEYVNETMRDLGYEKTTMFMRIGDTSHGLDGRDHYVTTAHETCRLVASIARGELVSPEACSDMLRILRRQQKREKLARDLPWNELNMLPDHRNNWVAHKGGTYIGGVRNDAGVMHGPAGDVAIAAFAEGGNDPTGREGTDALARIGRLVWSSYCNPSMLS